METDNEAKARCSWGNVAILVWTKVSTDVHCNTGGPNYAHTPSKGALCKDQGAMDP